MGEERNWFDDAVAEGIRRGIEKIAVDRCDGSDDPEERCPMYPTRCACTYVRWRNKPWFLRLFSKAPRRPTEDDCWGLIIEPVVDEAIRNRRAALTSKESPDPDTGRISPGHVCKHGVRWPHACGPCDEAALASKAMP